MMATRTQAAILSGPRGSVSVESIHLAEPGPGEVRLRMEACGLCHSDVFVTTLEKLPLAPVTLGHEGIGRVEAVGPDTAGWKPGDRAGLTFLGTTCGTCEFCAAGRDRFCPKQTNFGYTLQGALSDSVIAPAAALVRVPENLKAEIAAPLCCAGWTAYRAVAEAGLAPGQTLALFGYGGLGHLALQIGRHLGLKVAVSDPNQEKMEHARASGADGAVKGADAAIVLTAAPAAIPQAFRGLKRNGTLVLVGLSVANYELPLVDTVLKGITIRGSYLGARDDLKRVFALAEQGVLQPEIHSHALAEVPELIERLRRGQLNGRAVISF
jgi:propanol-preferring alcohol dehydrogenase